MFELNMNPARLEGESYEAYQSTRKKVMAETKRKLAGRVVHVSCVPQKIVFLDGTEKIVKTPVNGTYIIPGKHRPRPSKAQKKATRKTFTAYRLSMQQVTNS